MSHENGCSRCNVACHMRTTVAAVALGCHMRMTVALGCHMRMAVADTASANEDELKAQFVSEVVLTFSTARTDGGVADGWSSK